MDSEFTVDPPVLIAIEMGRWKQIQALYAEGRAICAQLAALERELGNIQEQLITLESDDGNSDH